ncbi:hypothetical protein [Roseimicrobium gellanilyticum]|nr:hypothetical protein [Roseimicrobium gellanilyticum]
MRIGAHPGAGRALLNDHDGYPPSQTTGSFNLEKSQEQIRSMASEAAE